MRAEQIVDQESELGTWRGTETRLNRSINSDSDSECAPKKLLVGSVIWGLGEFGFRMRSEQIVDRWSLTWGLGEKLRHT